MCVTDEVMLLPKSISRKLAKIKLRLRHMADLAEIFETS